MSKKSDVFWVSQKRGVPTSFKLFTGEVLGSVTLFRSLLM